MLSHIQPSHCFRGGAHLCKSFLMKIHILHNRNHRDLFRHLLVACLVSTRMLPSAPAQQTPGAPSPDEDEIVMMSPFEVSADQDYGYQATSTLAGGRIETDLKDTPAAISILTRDFMDDLALDSMTDFAAWSVSSEAVDPGSSNGFSGDFMVSTRGFGNNVYGSRNYFRSYSSSDNYNTERLEFSRGPNAMLFGEASVGGVATTWTKQAKLNRKIRVLSLKLDSFGTLRGALDYNYSPTKKFAIRVNALHADSKGWQEEQATRQKAFHIATSVSITKNTQFRAEFEHSERWRSIPIERFTDYVSSWNGDPDSTTGTANMASSDILVWNAARPEDGLLNWNGGYKRSTGTGLYMSTVPRSEIARFPVVPSDEFNANAPSSIGYWKTNTASVYLDRKVGKNLFLQVAYNYTRPEKRIENNSDKWNELYIDLNERLPNAELNPYYLTPYSEVTMSDQTPHNELHEFRAMGVWRFERSWTRQTFTILASHRTDNYESNSRRLVPDGIKSMSGSTATLYSSNSTADAIRIRRYWAALGPDSRPSSITNDYGTFPIEFRKYSTSESETITDGIQISSVSAYFRGRLSVIAGYKYDRYEKTSWATETRNPDGTPATFSLNKNPAINKHSPSIGGVYWIGWGLGLAVNYAKNFNPATDGSPDLRGYAMDPSTGRGLDFGVRFDMFDRKLTGSLNYYDNVNYGGSASPEENYDSTMGGAINAIWVQMGRDESVRTDYRERGDTKGKGWELEIVYNPTKNWRMRLAGNVPYNESIRKWIVTKEYVAEHRAEWEAFINDETQDAQTRHTAALNLQSLDNLFATIGAPGTRSTSTSIQWKANFFTSYRFPSGLLRGLTIGGGAHYTGKRLISRRLEDRSNIWNEDILLFNAMLRYQFKLLKKTVTMQLNVDNLLDNDQLDYRTTELYNGIYYYDRYNYLTPRRLTITTSIRF
jgi:outer membrane receptor protein involved in Fe transport